MTNILLVVAAALIDKDGYVMMAERISGEFKGMYEFPGGKVDAGETPEAALIRELEEELGIQTWQSCLAPIGFASHPYTDFHLLMPLFVCRKWDGFASGQQGQKLKWVKPSELMSLKMPPADIPLAVQLRDIL